MEESRCPEWVQVGRGLMEARCREYEEETGHWPDMALLERFSAEMRKRLDDFIRDPKGHPWRAVGLREFEEEISVGGQLIKRKEDNDDALY